MNEQWRWSWRGNSGFNDDLLLVPGNSQITYYFEVFLLKKNEKNNTPLQNIVVHTSKYNSQWCAPI